MSASKRTARDERRRRLGQNFLQPDAAGGLVAQCDFTDRDLVVEIGAGLGACTVALARHAGHVVALEKDAEWADRLRRTLRHLRLTNVSVRCCDALGYRFPRRPFRVFGSLPFGATTALLRHLLDEPEGSLTRADVVVQWEVARKRAATPPTTLLSATWAPWWDFEVVRRIPAATFRPAPAVDAGLLRVTRRSPPLLPIRLAPAYGAFVRENWS